MISIKASPDDTAKPIIENTILARMAMYEGQPPTYFIVTYNDKDQSVHIHGANKAEELNLTLSYLPDEALLAVVNNRNPDNSDDGRDLDSIIDLAADPLVPSHLEYSMARKEFVIGELEQRIIAKRDEKLGLAPRAFKNAGQPQKPPAPRQETPKPSASHLRLVIDNE